MTALLLLAQKPLALVFSTQEMPHEALLLHAGWDVRHVAMPCKNFLYCWANKPGVLNSFRPQVQAIVRGHKNVLLVGVSRGGYMALSMMDLPEVSRVAALSPMVVPNKPSEFNGPFAVPLDPSRIVNKPVYIEIGNNDPIVDTRAVLNYAMHAMNPKMTLVVTSVQGHVSAGPENFMIWFNKETAK